MFASPLIAAIVLLIKGRGEEPVVHPDLGSTNAWAGHPSGMASVREKSPELGDR